MELDRSILLVLLGCAVLFMMVSLLLPLITMPSHPPRILITKINDTVNIIWLGGIDSGFIGGFSVTVNNQTTYYNVPGVMGSVANFTHTDESCIDVQALDLSTKTYRPIGNSCM